MRRIGATHAAPGMVLGWGVYDSSGRIVFDPGDELDEDGVMKLRVLGVGEIVIEDSRVDDVPVEPLIPPAEEARCVQGLREAVLEAQMSDGAIGDPTARVEAPLNSIVDGLEGSILGEPSSMGCQVIEHYDFLHPGKVAGLSMVIGVRAGLDRKQIVNLGLACLFMNVGYASLPSDVLATSGPLTAEGWREVVKHPAVGAAMLSASGGVGAEVIEAAADSHERWDGSGYPSGKKGDEISQLAIILAVVDTFYALVSKRPHRGPFPAREAIEFIMAYSAELFDPRVVGLFVAQVPLYPTGAMVRLSSDEVGVVSDPNLGLVGRPTIRVCTDHLGKEVRRPFDMNLAAPEHQNNVVVQVLDY